jgi:hypothetical protein
MLESHFTAPWVLDRMRSGFMAPYLDALAAGLEAREYSRKSIRRQLRNADSFGRWLDQGQVPRGLRRGNPLYSGRVQVGDELFPGEHEAIIDLQTFDLVQTCLKQNSTATDAPHRTRMESLLRGLIYCSCCGSAMYQTYAARKERRYGDASPAIRSRHHRDRALAGPRKSGDHPPLRRC